MRKGKLPKTKGTEKALRARRIMLRTGKPHIMLLYGDMEALYIPGINMWHLMQAARWCSEKKKRGYAIDIP